MASPAPFLLGIDWGSQRHAVCLMGADGKTVAQRSIEHSADGINDGLTWLRNQVGLDLAVVAAAMEAPQGAFLEALLDAGASVFSLNPMQSDRFRDRYSAAGAKDDRRDAFVLADALRTDAHCFRQLEPLDPQTIRLRALTRQQTSFSRGLVRYTNGLREELQRTWPALLGLVPGADEPWLWALLERTPSPVQGSRLSLVAVTKLLKQQRIRRFSPHELLDLLRQPLLPVPPGVQQASASSIALSLPLIRVLHAQHRACAADIALLLEEMAQEPTEGQEGGEHRDVTILRSLPGAGITVVATLLAEAPEALSRRDYHALRAHAGIAPVTHQSGKHSSVVMRRACNARLRDAFYHFARVNAQLDPRSKALYSAARARGHSHGRALRTVAQRLIRLLIAMLRTHTLFDPNRPPQTSKKPLDEG
jgi:transposase